METQKVDATPSIPKLITKKALLAQLGWSSVTLWRHVKAGTFPAPVELGDGRARYNEAEVVEWFNNRPRREYGQKAVAK